MGRGVLLELLNPCDHFMSNNSIPKKRLRELSDKDKILISHLKKNHTDAENVLWQLLRRKSIKGIKFRRQHKIGKFILDFYSVQSRLAIEVDGMIHAKRVEYDAVRTQWFESLGIKVIRYSNDEVINQPEEVCGDIYATAVERLPFPLLKGKGPGVGVP